MKIPKLLLACLVVSLFVPAIGKVKAAQNVSVLIVSNDFSPNVVNIITGDTVTWTNNDSVARKVMTQGDLSAFNSGEIAPGKTYNFTFNNSGIYPYRNGANSNATGLVIVEPAELPDNPTGSTVKPVDPENPKPTGNNQNDDNQNPPTNNSGSNEPRFIDGTLVNDHGTIFILEYGKKRPFASMNVFNKMGYKLSNVTAGDTSTIESSDGIFTPNIRHVRGSVINDHGTLYFVGKDFRYGFPSKEVFLSWGLRFQDAVVSNSEDAKLPTGPVIEMKK